MVLIMRRKLWLIALKASSRQSFTITTRDEGTFNHFANDFIDATYESGKTVMRIGR